MNKTSDKIREFAVTSLFAAIIFLMAFTPIGFIHLGTIKATIVHIPVIIASVILGPKVGAALGALFGLTSLINNTISPALLSFAFSPLIPVPGMGRGSILALAVCFIPRILVGVVPYYVDLALRNIRKGDGKWRAVSLFAAGVSGSLTNTLLVMGLIHFIFQDAAASAHNVAASVLYRFIFAVIFAHGIPEAVIAGIFTAGVGKALLAYRQRKQRNSAV